MNFEKEIYIEYYDRKQDKMFLNEKLQPKNRCFTEYIKQDLLETMGNKDSELLELQMLPLYIFERDIEFAELLELLNILLVQDWHEQHENIVYFLEKMASVSSVSYLMRAIDSHYEYLQWDTNCAFERKCIWTLGLIGNSEAISVLQKLKESQPPISSYADEQLKRLESLKLSNDE